MAISRTARWWQRRCTGLLRGPEVTLFAVWRCDLRKGHAGRCHFEPDEWPELAQYGGWRGLRDMRQKGSSVEAGETS